MLKGSTFFSIRCRDFSRPNLGQVVLVYTNCSDTSPTMITRDDSISRWIWLIVAHELIPHRSSRVHMIHVPDISRLGTIPPPPPPRPRCRRLIMSSSDRRRGETESTEGIYFHGGRPHKNPPASVTRAPNMPPRCNQISSVQ